VKEEKRGWKALDFNLKIGLLKIKRPRKKKGGDR
jgi:hypothetical protein